MVCTNFLAQMNQEAVKNYPEAAQTLIATLPPWPTAVLVLAVFIGVPGDIFLLLIKAVVSYLFILSSLGVLVTNIHTLQVSSAPEIWIGSLMPVSVAVFLICYTQIVKMEKLVAPVIIACGK